MPNKTWCPVLCPGGCVRTLCPAVSGVRLVLLAVSGNCARMLCPGCCVRLFAGGALSECGANQLYSERKQL
eukprot:15478432-Alexandrium_andersonii.AAC.1